MGAHNNVLNNVLNNELTPCDMTAIFVGSLKKLFMNVLHRTQGGQHIYLANPNC